MTSYPNGVWPVMLTPYRMDGAVDHDGLAALTNWYLAGGAAGLFAACQSSEIFYLSPQERAAVVETTVRAVDGRVPVVASGHVSPRLQDTLEEMRRMADAGADAFILISNRLADADETDDVLLDNLGEIVSRSRMNLGIYECPYPYKRLLTEKVLRSCADSGRFYFLKDTCCDAELIARRLQWLKGSPMKLFNANTATLLPTLRQGAAGYSGVMANFHPRLYVWLCQHPEHPGAEKLQECLSLASLAERKAYPACAKYYLRACEALPIEIISRTANAQLLTGEDRDIIRQMARMCDHAFDAYTREGGRT